MTTPRPLHDRVILRRVTVDTAQIGSIVIPENRREKTQIMRVMAVGPDAYKRGRAPLRAGSRVLIGRQAGTDVKIGGIEYVIVRASDLLALVMA